MTSKEKMSAEGAELLKVVEQIKKARNWEQGRRSPRGAAKTLLKIAQSHPNVLEQLAL